MEEAERYVRTWVAAPRDKDIEDTVSGMGPGADPELPLS